VEVVSDVAEAHALDGAATSVSDRSPAVKAGRLGVFLAAGLATTVWSLLALLTSNPWIFPDELLYSEVAKSLAAGDLPAVRQVTSLEYGFLYPLVISPAWLFDDVQTAYSVARVINGAVMAVAAVPIFYLARRFTSGRKALLVACFSVAVPSMAYAGTLMTEVALYPAMAFAILAITRAVDRPTPRSQALALGAILLAFLVKPIAVVLIAAYPVAVLVHCLGSDGPALRAALGRYRFTWCALAAGGALGVAGGAVLAGDPVAVLGAYAVAAGHVDALGTGRWLVANFSALALYVVVIPFAATLAVLAHAWTRGADRDVRLFAAVSAPTIVAVVAAVAAFGSEGHAGAEGFTGAATAVRERNLFFVAPLLLIGLAIWTDVRKRGSRWSWLAAGASLGLVGLYPWSDVPRAANPQNLASLPFLVPPTAAWSAVAAVTVAVLALALWLRVPAHKLGYLWMTIGGWFVLTAFVAVTVFVSAASKTERWRPADDASWIDRIVPDGAAVAVLWSERGSERYAAVADKQRVVWLNEFYNRSIGRVYELGPKMPYNLPAQRVRTESRAVRTLSGAPVMAPYVLVRCPMAIDGALVAEHAASGARLYRMDGALRLAAPRRCTSA
jgi:hypothetical protein